MRVALLLLWLVATAPSPLRLHVTPRQGFVPLDVRVELYIAPHPDNRRWELVYGRDPVEMTESSQTLDGANAEPLILRHIRLLEPGRYAFVAVVIGVDGVRGEDLRWVHVHRQ